MKLLALAAVLALTGCTHVCCYTPMPPGDYVRDHHEYYCDEHVKDMRCEDYWR